MAYNTVSSVEPHAPGREAVKVNLTQIVCLAGGFFKNVVMMTGFIMFLNSVMKIYLGVPLYVGLPLAIYGIGFVS